MAEQIQIILLGSSLLLWDNNNENDLQRQTRSLLLPSCGLFCCFKPLRFHLLIFFHLSMLKQRVTLVPLLLFPVAHCWGLVGHFLTVNASPFFLRRYRKKRRKEHESAGPEILCVDCLRVIIVQWQANTGLGWRKWLHFWTQPLSSTPLLQTS